MRINAVSPPRQKAISYQFLVSGAPSHNSLASILGTFNLETSVHFCSGKNFIFEPLPTLVLLILANAKAPSVQLNLEPNPRHRPVAFQDVEPAVFRPDQPRVLPVTYRI